MMSVESGLRNRVILRDSGKPSSILGGLPFSLSGLVGCLLCVTPFVFLGLVVFDGSFLGIIIIIFGVLVSGGLWVQVSVFNGLCIAGYISRWLAWHKNRFFKRNSFVAGTSGFIEVPQGKRGQRKLARALLAEYKGKRNALVNAGFVLPDVPGSVGAVEGMDLELDGGVIGVIYHRSEGYWSFCFELAPTPRSVVNIDEWLRPNRDWAELQQLLVRNDSKIDVIQQVNRVVGWDDTDHISWLSERIPDGMPDVLTDSYSDVIDEVVGEAVQHRTWIICRIPSSARGFGSVSAAKKSLVEEAKIFRDIADNFRDMPVRPLSCSRLASVIKSLQDPGHPIDDYSNVNLFNCFLPHEDYPDYLLLHTPSGDWLQRTISLNGTNFEPGLLSLEVFRELVSCLPAQVPRTITFTINLIPANVARRQIRMVLTDDSAAASSALNKISVGDEELQVQASRLIHKDLIPGSGQVGVRWVIKFAYQAKNFEDLAGINRRLPAILNECSIASYQKDRYIQGSSWVASLPLARGIKPVPRHWWNG